uniref:SIR2 family protein n=1 Tax=Bacteroides finegoldii TaxID=338188 RepID=UPI003569D4D5
MILKELSHKRKTVADLIRFIGNTSENHEVTRIKAPNYSVLLGSGASITSGIRSGQNLIDIWKNEVYQESDKTSEMTIEEFFSSTNAPDWYEESNAYSALFENRYDLQRHRRIFVEHEVSGKTPSIGYAYLVKLIEQGFFNTVFTTNFDDLLNEAFYRFSKNRPIVCAHDSSISGISVTSTRPKIIKLHGDYLFDDIKTTLRETESLEMNMKMKFQEFAKDFGLIVVGYAGNDHSIMDILTYLLQHEDYFKNGIYWCIRKGERSISAELKKLLWRDRVFFVEIDGFDELFAEINHKLNNGALPIDDAFLSRTHQETIIKELTENDRLSLDNTFLAEDCKKLKDHYEDNFANDFLEYIRKQKADSSKNNENKRARKRLQFPKLTLEEQKELNDLISEAYGLRHPIAVLQKLQAKNVFDLEDGRFKIELLELEADLQKEMKDEVVRKYFNELIRLDPTNERYYEIAANRSSDATQSLNYLSLACERFNNDYYIINSYISSLLDFWEDRVKQENFSSIAKTIEDYINKSLQLYPYIDNSAFSYRVRYIQLVYADNRQKMQEGLDSLCNDVTTKYKYHPQTLYILRLTKSKFLSETWIKESLDFYYKADNDHFIEQVYIELLHWYNSKNEFNKVLETFVEFEKGYLCSDKYKYLKGKLLMAQEYFEDALEVFRTLPNNPKANEQIMTIMAYQKKNDELTKFYNELNNKGEYREHYYSLIDNHQELIDLYKEKSTTNSLTKSEVVAYAFSLLKMEDYDSVISLLKPYYDNPQLTDGAIIVNYQCANLNRDRNAVDRKTIIGKIKAKIKEKIFDNKYIDYSDFEKFGATCIIGDMNEIVSYLNKLIKVTPLDKYVVSGWPVLAPYLGDSRIQRLLAPSEKTLKLKTQEK